MNVPEYPVISVVIRCLQGQLRMSRSDQKIFRFLTYSKGNQLVFEHSTETEGKYFTADLVFAS